MIYLYDDYLVPSIYSDSDEETVYKLNPSFKDLEFSLKEYSFDFVSDDDFVYIFTVNTDIDKDDLQDVINNFGDCNDYLRIVETNIFKDKDAYLVKIYYEPYISLNELTENEVFERDYSTHDSRVDLHKAGISKADVYRSGGSKRINRNGKDTTKGLSSEFFKKYFSNTRQQKIVNVRVKNTVNNSELQNKSDDTISNMHVSFQLTLWGYTFTKDNVSEVLYLLTTSKDKGDFGKKLFEYVKNIVEKSEVKIDDVELCDIDEFKPLKKYNIDNSSKSFFAYWKGNVLCMSY